MTASLNASEKQSIQRAVKLIKRAVTHEEFGTLAIALSLYRRGLNHLLLVLHSPRCTDRLGQILRRKCRQYQHRAEALRKAVKRGYPTTGEEIPESLTEVLDRALVQAGGESCLQAAWRWVDCPNAGVEEMESGLKEVLMLPVLFPLLFNAYMFHCPRSLLLYGCPGDGVLDVLLHFTRQSYTPALLIVSAHCLLKMAVAGEDSMLVWKTLWSRARRASPCAVCVTDLEVFRMGRTAEDGPYPIDVVREMSSELLTHLEVLTKLQELTFFIGITSQPWLVDKVLLRHLDVLQHWPSPSPEQRSAVLLSALRGVPHTLGAEDLQRVGSLTEQFTRSDMEILAEEAQARVKQRVQEARFFRPVSGHGQTDTTLAGGNRPRLSAENDGKDGNCEDGSERPDSRETVESGVALQKHTVPYQPHGDDGRSVGKTRNTPGKHPSQLKSTPCDNTDSDAVPVTWQELGAEQLQEPPLTLQDVLMALGNLQGQIDNTHQVMINNWHDRNLRH